MTSEPVEPVLPESEANRAELYQWALCVHRRVLRGVRRHRLGRSTGPDCRTPKRAPATLSGPIVRSAFGIYRTSNTAATRTGLHKPRASAFP